ncbi:MAG: tetratricopeptide repeat protein [Candidatus Eremiobacteraeota bacterium]|nr:tetratricopeptide repeat protein [Candidatus Eremiobacteraeota bacterium]
MKRLLYGGVLFLFVLFAGAKKILDYDIFGHIAAGKALTEFGFMDRDIFTFTFQGKPWANIYWLFQIAAYHVHSLAGFTGIVIAKILGAGLLMLFLYLACKNRVGGRDRELWPVFLPLLLLGFLVVSLRVVERPHLVGLVLVAFYLYVLGLPPGRLFRRALLCIPFLQVLWVNMHGSFIEGPLLVAVFLIEEYGGEARNALGSGTPLREALVSPLRRGTRAFSLLILFIVVALVNFISPLWQWTYGIIGLFRAEEVISLGRIAEWIPYTLSIDASDMGLSFFRRRENLVLLFTLLWVIGASARPGRLRLSDMLLFIAGFSAFIMHSRFVSDFALFLTPSLVVCWCSCYEGHTRAARTLLAAFLIAGTFLFSFFWARSAIASRDLGFTVKKSRFSYGAVQFMEAHRLGGNIFNLYSQGYFLEYALYPRVKVFIDGRPVILFNPAFFFIYGMAVAGEKFSLIEKSYPFDMVLIDRDSPLFRKLIAGSDWKLVYVESAGGLFIKSSSPLRDVRNYRINWISGEVLNMAPRDRSEQIRLIEELLACYQENGHLLYMLSQLYWQQKDTGKALALLDRMREADPDDVRGYIRKADYLMALGRNNEASKLLAAALWIFPDHPLLLLRQSACYAREERYGAAYRLMATYMSLYRDVPSVEAYTSMGMLSIRARHDGKKAIEYFTIALYHAGSPDEEVQALFNLASAYDYCALYNDEIKIYAEILTTRPRNAEAMMRLGDALVAKGEREKGIETYMAVCRSADAKWAPRAEEALRRMGISVEREKRGGGSPP